MITLNPIQTNTKSLNFKAKHIFCEETLCYEIPKDKFIHKNTCQNIDVLGETKKIIKNPIAINIIKSDLEKLQQCKQRTTCNEDGSRKITFYNGLFYMPWLYRGEFNYDKNNNLQSVIIANKNKETYKGHTGQKIIEINHLNGINISYKKPSEFIPFATINMDLSGKMVEHSYLDKKGDSILCLYKNGKIFNKRTSYVATFFDEFSDRFYDDKGKLTKYVISYPDRKIGGRIYKIYDDKNNLIEKRHFNIIKDKKIYNKKEIYRNNKTTFKEEIIDPKDKFNYYSVKKDNFEIKYKLKKKINYLINAEVKIPVKVYKNEQYIGTRKIKLKNLTF